MAPFRYTELMWSAAVGFLVFDEIPAVSTLIGAAVIIPGTLYVVWAENQKSEGEERGGVTKASPSASRFGGVFFLSTMRSRGLS